VSKPLEAWWTSTAMEFPADVTLTHWLDGTDAFRAVVLDRLESCFGTDLVLARHFGIATTVPWVVEPATSHEFVLVFRAEAMVGEGPVEEAAVHRFLSEAERLQLDDEDLRRLEHWRAPAAHPVTLGPLLVSVRSFSPTEGPRVTVRGQAPRDPSSDEWCGLMSLGGRLAKEATHAHPFGVEELGAWPERCGSKACWLFDPPIPSEGWRTFGGGLSFAEFAGRAAHSESPEEPPRLRPVFDLSGW
jgi:hypothetical protein